MSWKGARGAEAESVKGSRLGNEGRKGTGGGGERSTWGFEATVRTRAFPLREVGAEEQPAVPGVLSGPLGPPWGARGQPGDQKRGYCTNPSEQ